MSTRALTRSFLLGVTLSMAALASQPHAQAPQPPQAGDRFAANQILIQFQASATDTDREDARGWVNARFQARVRRGQSGDLELATLSPGIPVEFAVDLLSRHPAVRFAEPNWVYTHQATSNDPYYVSSSLWGMYGDATTPSNQYGSQAGEAWAAGHTGSSSTIVGVIDEGIDISHPDLAANIWTNPVDVVDGLDNDNNGYVDDIHGWDFFEDNNSLYDGSDDHGTHVSGTIGAKGGNGAGVAGVNWNVTIIGAKFLGPNGGSTADAVRAVDYITDLKVRHNLKIVATNNSWGGGGYSQALHDAIIRAANAGILFVAAAGNSNRNNDSVASYPSNYRTTDGTSTQGAASYDGVLAVAALTSTGAKASYSSYGSSTVDLGAPGSGINSTLPGNAYGSYSGTSMATPHVTGAAALYASMNPGADAQSIRSAILSSAQNTPTASLDGITVTDGRLNIDRFLGAPASPPSAPSVLTATPNTATQITLAWLDNSNDEQGVRIERCTGSGCTTWAEIATVGANATGYVNSTGLSAGTTYRYRVRAYKDALNSSYSNAAQATTLSAPGAIALTAVGSKVKGVQHASLTWGPSGSGNVDVFRSGTKVTTTVNDGSHLDNINKKGGGSYIYKVCVAGTSTCSNESTVTF